MLQDGAPPSRQWYALRSKPRQESLAASLLDQAGVEVYLPRERVRNERTKTTVLVPFFPGYLFSRLAVQLAEIRLAAYTPGVLYVVGYGDEPWPVPDELIAYIRQRLAPGQRRVGPVDFHPGDRLVIIEGPLRGIEAVFDRQVSATGRVRVLVQVLKRLCPAELSVRQVRRLGKAVGAASS